MYLKVLNSRKGISPVISEIILAAAVLTVGSAVWYFSLGYCSITSDYYISDTLELLNTVIERYTVEKVSNNTDGTSLKIWINNYGEIPIIVDVYAYTANKSGSSFNITIPSGALKMVNIDFSTQPLELGEMVKIKVYSWRQNIVYSDYTAHPPS